MAFKGMNPEEGREVAALVDEAVTVVNELSDHLTTTIMGVEWVGPDYDAFTEEWNSFTSNEISALADAYKQKANELTTHAEEQDTTSNH